MSLPSTRPEWLSVAMGALLAIGFGALYVKTAPADIVLGDTPEFMIDASILGVAHAPGYPLLTMLGALATKVPLGSIPHRLDLLAALFSAGTVVLVYLTALRVTRSPFAAGGTAAFLGVNALFWRWANVLETFPLNDLLAAGMLYLVVLWHERPQRAAYLVAGAFVGGLGMTNHQTIALLAPAVLFVLWLRWRYLAAHPGVILACAGAFALGLLPYAYVFWAAARHPAFNWQGVSSFGDFLDLVTRKSYGSTDLIPTAQYRGGSAAARVAALVSALGPAGLLILVGLGSAYRRARWYAVMSVVGFATAGVFFTIYSNVNLDLPFTLAILERFFLLPLTIVAPLGAFGLLELAERAAALRPSRRLWATAGVYSVAFASVLGLGVAAIGEVDRSDYHAARNFAEDIFSTLEPNTLLFAGGDEVVLPVSYLQLVEQKRPDVRVLMLGLLGADWYLRQLRERYPDVVVPFKTYVGQKDAMKSIAEANEGRPIYLMGIAPDSSIKDKYWWLSRGITLKLLPLSVDVTLEDLESDNERLFSTYRPPAVAQMRNGSLDRVIPINYAQGAFRVGLEHENVQIYDGARQWYERALAFDPNYSLARDRLAKLPK